MSEPGDSKDAAKTAEGPQARHAGPTKKPAGSAPKRTTREERLAKALRDNLRRRKSGEKKD